MRMQCKQCYRWDSGNVEAGVMKPSRCKSPLPMLHVYLRNRKLSAIRAQLNEVNAGGPSQNTQPSPETLLLRCC